MRSTDRIVRRYTGSLARQQALEDALAGQSEHSGSAIDGLVRDAVIDVMGR
jgi:hypothetical protein